MNPGKFVYFFAPHIAHPKSSFSALGVKLNASFVVLPTYRRSLSSESPPAKGGIHSKNGS
jgi:hypothetical protein